jgi:hypothetical protein
MISLIVQMPEDTAVEVGAEGAIGMAAGLGSGISFICALVQVSITTTRIAKTLDSLVRVSTGARRYQGLIQPLENSRDVFGNGDRGDREHDGKSC